MRCRLKLMKIQQPIKAEKLMIQCSKPVTITTVDFVMLGFIMRQMRKQTKMSLRMMARRLKISAPFLSDCELG